VRPHAPENDTVLTHGKSFSLSTVLPLGMPHEHFPTGRASCQTDLLVDNEAERAERATSLKANDVPTSGETVLILLTAYYREVGGTSRKGRHGRLVRK
jgi:hypothetical protein